MKKYLVFVIVALLPITYGCKEIVVKYEDSGKTMHLMVDQILKVHLPSNAGSGSDWREIAYNDSLIRRMGKPNYMLGDGSSGSEGITMFRFKGVKPGETKLIMEYGNKYDSDKLAEKVFELTIVVIAKR